MTDVWVAFGVALAPWAALTYVRLRRFLHILQLEEYLTPQYLHWLRSNPRRYLAPVFSVVGLAISIASAAFLVAGLGEYAWAVPLLWGYFPVVLRIRGWLARPTPRKPLVMTSRARRLLIIAVVLEIVCVAAGLGGGWTFGELEAVAAGVLATFLVCALAGHVVAGANLALWPFEELSRRRWQRLAAEKLRASRPRIIAITGSAGKTTTKELVAHLLSAKYRVLKTPASFNTPLGIARTVNDSYDGQDYFVVEMGAYKSGEIARLCRLVGGTDVSVITTVNAQHLERFGSLQATAAAKFEIVEGLRPGGTAVLNFDVAAVRELVKGREFRHRVAAQDERIKDGASQDQDVDVVAIGVEWEDVGLWGTNVVETRMGIEMDVTWDGETVHVATRLLARHNATNVLAAMGVGLACGLELGYMAAAIGRFEPPEHRLQRRDLSNGVTLLDDGYNANPEGIIGALKVLGSYAPRRRVVVTSGLIEMGREKAAYHARIGKAAARYADVAVLVGPKQTSDIRAAMLEAGFAAQCVHVARNPEDAEAVLAAIGQAGDVVLHSTDLPDQFDEYLVI
jgi:UDP-N-acetylmuramoyl-tripeptide--D-alanyl-D-alanine ligase